MSNRKVPPSVRVVETGHSCKSCRFFLDEYFPLGNCVKVEGEPQTYSERDEGYWAEWHEESHVQPNEVCDEFEKMEEEQS